MLNYIQNFLRNLLILLFSISGAASIIGFRKHLNDRIPNTIQLSNAAIHKSSKHILIISADTTYLYLTFDDGPIQGSDVINNIVVSDSIKINVFIIGHYVFRDSLTRTLFKAYRTNPFIEIGNHSFTHANKHYHSYYQDPQKVKCDFILNQDTLHLTNNLARLPGRNCWRIAGRSRNDIEDAVAAADTLYKIGYQVFGWDLEWRADSSGHFIESVDQMIEKISERSLSRSTFTSGNIVLLCHDHLMADTSNEIAMRSFIKRVKAIGTYKFQHLSRYPIQTP